jgi:uncharacterized membrane protein YcaP (DUF421 family)
MNAIFHAVSVILGLPAERANDLTVLQVCARAIVIYLVLIAYVRLGKKRFLGEATAFDAILVIMLGSLASRGISGNAPFHHALASVLVLIAFHWLLSDVAADWPSLSDLMKGTSTVLIRNGCVDRDNLRNAHMSDDDLAEDLRQKGIASIDEVKEARLERSGTVSVIKRR